MYLVLRHINVAVKEVKKQEGKKDEIQERD